MTKVNTLKLSPADYPDSLSSIPQPPKQLYIKGAGLEQWIERPKIAVVGSRKVSPYGRRVSEDLAGRLARQGVVIISGLAYGVDAIAHRAALTAGGTAIAVLPTPLDSIYPAAHHHLSSDIIAAGGALISEYPSGSPVYKLNFTARNRIISALADAVLITEATINSGSLHTARHALEQGKTVMAVPGNIDSPTSVGCNNLIKSGAVPVTDASDVFFALGISPAQNKNLAGVFGSPEEQSVLELLRGGVHTQEEIAIACQMDGQAVAAALTMLEINGAIKPYGGGRWIAV